jgi:hypothetical protein
MNALTLVSIIPFIFGAVGMTLHPDLAVNNAAFWGIFAVLGVFNVLNLIFSLVMPLALVTTIDELHHGRTIDVNSAYKKAFSVAIPYLVVLLLSAIAVLGGSVLLIIPGIIANVYFMFVIFVFLFEGKRGLDALAQSAWYVRGLWLDVFARKIAIGVIVFVSLVLFMAVAGGLSLFAGFGIPVFSFLIDLFLFMFIVPFTICFSYSVYRNLRSIKEHESHKAHYAGFIADAEKISVILLVVAALAALTVFTLFIFWPGHFSGILMMHGNMMTTYHHSHGFMGY